MPNPLANQPLSFGPELAGVPYLDQYWGAWVIDEEFAKFLVSHAQNINLQLHLEHHADQAASGNGGRRPGDVFVDENGIAHIELSGTLMKHCSSMTAGTSMALARRQVRAAAASADVKGILLCIDSPGGTVAGTADLAADIRAAGSKKPCFAFIEDCGASGAYWLASQAQRIGATPTTLVGSIGVFTVVEDTSKAAENEGVKVHVVRYGAMKGMGTPGTKVTDEQLAYMQQRIDGFAEDFISAIATGRKLSRDQAAELADGKVHKGAAAKKLGLVDAIESFDETLAALVAETKKSKSSPRSKSPMSEANNNAAAFATLESIKPAAATLPELRENCIGASDSFLLKQLEINATLPQAMKAHAAQMKADNDALAKERDELKTKAAEAEKKPAKRGVAPLATGDGEDEASEQWDGLSANEFMDLKIQDRVSKGMSRERASKSVFAAHPTLRDAVVAEANERRRK